MHTRIHTYSMIIACEMSSYIYSCPIYVVARRAPGIIYLYNILCVQFLLCIRTSLQICSHCRIEECEYRSEWKPRLCNWSSHLCVCVFVCVCVCVCVWLDQLHSLGYMYISPIHTLSHTQYRYRLPNGCTCLDVAVARKIADTQHFEFFPSEGGVSFVQQSRSELWILHLSVCVCMRV